MSMKYTSSQYAQALLETVYDKQDDKQKKIIRNFLIVVLKNGDWLRLPEILRKFEKLYLDQSRLHKVEIESAHPIPSRVEKEIQTILSDNIYIKKNLDANLYAGIKVLINNEVLIDATAKHLLEKMF